ncbi:hypothetical protein KKG46_04720 [Patescibacteria group bacterium]|nr:hypothetical protein [Patescibacteria group bacterium]
MFTRIIIGLVLVVFGAILVIKTNGFMDFFGSMDWADRYLGGGGSRLMYKLLGILASIIGFMVMFDLWDNFLNATLGSLFKFG